MRGDRRDGIPLGSLLWRLLQRRSVTLPPLLQRRSSGDAVVTIYIQKEYLRCREENINQQVIF